MIVAIGGASNAGKTSLARQLRDFYAQKRVALLCQDDFVKAVENIPTVRNHVDWEHPDSIDHEKFYQAIKAENTQNDLVIAEGLMVFWHLKTVQLFDKSIFITLDYNTFSRRKARDNRWGYEPEWYVEHIWLSYLAFGQPPAHPAPLMVNGNQALKLKPIIEYLEA